MPDGEPYSGLFGAFRYAFAQSGSWLFRGYVLLSALVGAYASLLLALGTVSWIASPGPLGQKALLGVIGVLVLAPLFAPVLIVARRHRLDRDRPGADRTLSLAGLVFLLSLMLALVVTDPNDHSGPGPFGEALALLDSLPATYGLAFPAAGALLVYLAVRYTRR